jgi:hypothetical protein
VSQSASGFNPETRWLFPEDFSLQAAPLLPSLLIFRLTAATQKQPDDCPEFICKSAAIGQDEQGIRRGQTAFND